MSLRHRLTVALGAVLVVGTSLAVRAQRPVPDAAGAPPPLTSAQQERVDAHLLRVENARLRAALAQLQAELDSLRLTAERTALVEQLRRELGAAAGAEFDWTLKRFLPPPQEPKP